MQASDINLVFLYSTIKMMHGPINIRFTLCLVLEMGRNAFLGKTSSKAICPSSPPGVT